MPIGMAMMAFRGVHRDLFPLPGVLTIVPVSALILSGSRGGIIGFVFEVGILALLLRGRRTSDSKFARTMALGLILLVALAVVAWVGAGRAIEKFSSLNAHDVSLGRRASMFRGAAHIFLNYPISGSGLGTLVSVYPRYETAYDGRVVDHVHNDYIELLAEAGVVGGLCGASFLWLLYREARKGLSAETRHF